jgi:TRAP-type transport system periplasmic protein
MEGIKRFDPAELHDVHHVFTFAAGEGYLMSKKPITSLADMRGMQIGGTAGPRAEAIRALGATEVILPMPEWYEALDRGIMEAGICPLEALQGFRIGEVTADYMLSTPYLYNQIFFFVMNLDAWNSMPADLQEIFTDYSNQYYEEMMKGLFDELGEKALEFTKNIKGKDPQINYLSAADEKKMVELIEPILDAYAAELDGKGLPGAEIVNLAKELTEKYN